MEKGEEVYLHQEKNQELGRRTGHPRTRHRRDERPHLADQPKLNDCPSSHANMQNAIACDAESARGGLSRSQADDDASQYDQSSQRGLRCSEIGIINMQPNDEMATAKPTVTQGD